LAETYGTLRPGNIQVGWGLQRRKWGATTIRILDALGALTGNYGVSGGGVTFYYKRRGAFATSRYQAPPDRHGIPEALLGSGILEATDPPVRAVVIDNGNPVAMLPDSRTVARALESRELVVVLEQFLTDTAQCAQVVLPVTTLLEESDVLGAFGHHHLIASNPVAARPAKVRSDLEIYQALAERLGFGERLAGTPAEWAERLLEPVRDRVSLEALRRGAVRNPLAPPVLFEGRRFRTPDGRFHFVSDVALDEDLPPAGFPLQLGCFSTPKAQSSQWSMAWDGRPIEARCHPQSSRGLRDGDVVQVTSRIGSMRVTLRLDATLRRDMLLIPKGGWLEHGCAANTLVRAETTDLGLGAVYYDEWVRLDPDPSLESRDRILFQEGRT
jgi:anaerobic selenocysteine-containing dehydrogenase